MNVSTQKERADQYKDRVNSYYNIITEPYRRFWGEYFHPAFFEHEEQSLAEALDRTHRLFIKDSGAKAGSQVVDLGCGIGSLSRLIARETHCDVTGVNFNEFQIKKALQITEKEGLKNVLFLQADIMDLSSLSQKFNAAFLIDVGCHLPDKKKAIEQIHNILLPGGRLIVADWLQKDGLNAFEKELLIEPFNEYWNYPYMESLEGYKRIFRSAGFREIKAEDASERTRPNWNYFYEIAIRQINGMDLKKMLGYLKNPVAFFSAPKKHERIAKNQFYANVFTKICFDAGVFRYGYFVVEKKL